MTEGFDLGPGSDTHTSQTEDDCSPTLMEQRDNRDTSGERGTSGGQGPLEEGRRETDRQGRPLASPWTTHSGAINIPLFVYTAMPTFSSHRKSQSPEQFEVEGTENCPRVLETAIEAYRDSVNKWWWCEASTSTGLRRPMGKAPKSCPNKSFLMLEKGILEFLWHKMF